MINPTATGPKTTPNCQPASNLANPDVLFDVSVISAILPPADGLTALPRRPFISLAPISNINSRENEIGKSCANLIIAAKRNKEMAQTIKDRKNKVEWQGERVENRNVDETAIEYCERMYPNTTNEFKKIQEEMYETFCKKQRNYGPDNISVGSNLETDDEIKISLTGLWFRMNDKIQRLKQLVVLGQPDEVGENIQDTYEDMSVYGIIAQIVQRKKWAK